MQNDSCTHLELCHQIFRHFLQQTDGWFLLAKEHQLQVQVPFQQQPFSHQTHPHHAPQRPCGLILMFTVDQGYKERIRLQLSENGSFLDPLPHTFSPFLISVSTVRVRLGGSLLLLI